MSQPNPTQPQYNTNNTNNNRNPNANGNPNPNRHRRRHNKPQNMTNQNATQRAESAQAQQQTPSPNPSEIYQENLNALNRNFGTTRPQQRYPQRSLNSSETPQQQREVLHQQREAPQQQRESQPHNRTRHHHRKPKSAPTPSQPQPQEPQQQPQEGQQSHPKPRPFYRKPEIPSDALESRYEVLIEQLHRKKYECMICCSIIRSDVAIWSCAQCHHMYHLYCVKKWARSQLGETPQPINTEWRCPACQSVHSQIPNVYKCFCGKKTNPECSEGQTAHSCGEVCGRSKKNANASFECVHKCTMLCHPGPCPTCEAIVSRKCGCGKSRFQVKCSSSRTPMCTSECAKLLDCGRHKCTRTCHDGACDPCDVVVEQKCESHVTLRHVNCNELKSGALDRYECVEKCSKTLNCGNHTCQRKCHGGVCNPCELLPENVKFCACGATPISDLPGSKKREKCTDPLETCTRTCLKALSCSTDDDLHVCQSKCHTGECAKCEKVVKVSCQCGSESETLKCYEAQKYKLSPKKCQKRCQAKKSCGRHKCTEVCCDNHGEHICMLVCDRALSCGNHRCEQLCHKGNCPRCLVASFDELHCHCGLTVVYPPIRCGTKMPDCSHPCLRPHQCDHPVLHNCHQDDQCLPCSFLTEKMCMGGHEVRRNIPCHQKEVSCGLQCGKALPCGMHKCQKTCHKGECMVPGEKCVQPCSLERPHCSHLCLSPCHFGEKCPDTVCQAIVTLKCKCGLKTQKAKCLQRTYDSSSVMFENLASELKDMLTTKSINLSSFQSSDVLKKKTELECDEECLIAKRNKEMALALQIDADKAKDGSEIETPPVALQLEKSGPVKMPHVSMEKKIKSISNKWVSLAERDPIEIRKSPFSVLMDIDSDEEKQLTGAASKEIDYFEMTD